MSTLGDVDRVRSEVECHLLGSLGIGACACGKTNPARVTPAGPVKISTDAEFLPGIVAVRGVVPTIYDLCGHREKKSLVATLMVEELGP